MKITTLAKAPEALFYGPWKHPTGITFLMAWDEKARLYFADNTKHRSLDAILKEWRKKYPHTTLTKAAWRKGEPKDFAVMGTKFQQDVWKTLLTIKPGKTLSYGDIAKIIKRPKAVRAVGNAVGKNPIAPFIPCHRVLAANNKLGGYSGGLPVKVKLLEFEGVKAA